MKVICDRSALLNAINTVSGAVASRTPRVQLTCVKLSATKAGGVGELTLSGTDAEMSLHLKISQVDVQEPGEALIPADKLRQIVSAEDEEATLTIESQADFCHIRGADAQFKVYGFPPAEFPPLPDFADVVAGTHGQTKAKAVFTQPAGLLDSIISRTIFATARENSRYAINGVLMKREGKKLEMVATDGRRLALCRTTLASAGDKDAKSISCIIPTKALSQFQKLVRDGEENVQIAITDNQIHFSFGSDKDPHRAVLSSNLIEGSFPPYDEVIPKDQDKKISFDKDRLLSAVRRASVLTNEESRGVKMRFSGKDKILELKSRAPEMGESDVTIELAGYDGEDVEIGFNPAFIIDALKVVTGSEVIIELKAPNKPGLIKSGTDFLYVVMPVNLQ